MIRVDGDPYENLANAVIVTAADDYRSAMKKLQKDPDNILARSTVDECASFFRSAWFEILSDADGEYILQRLRDEFPDVAYDNQ